MKIIAEFFKSLLQLSRGLLIVFGLFFLIGGGLIFHDLQYRYVVESRYNTIFDKAYNVYLINKGKSMTIINNHIYAINDDVYMTINQENNIIHVYYLNSHDSESIKSFTNLQQHYYGDKLIIQSIERLGSSEEFDVYKQLLENPKKFKSQGIRFSF